MALATMHRTTRLGWHRRCVHRRAVKTEASGRNIWAIVIAESERRRAAIESIRELVAPARTIVAVEEGESISDLSLDNVVETGSPISSAATLLDCFLFIFRRDPSAELVVMLGSDRAAPMPGFPALIDRARLAAEGSDNRAVAIAIPAELQPSSRSGVLPIAENEDETWSSLFVSDSVAAPFRFASVLVATSSALFRLYETAFPQLLRTRLSRRSPAVGSMSEIAPTVDPELLVRASPVIKALVAA